MERREFVKLTATAPLLWLLPHALRAAPDPRWERILVLVELGGGNDGLNTVVPYRDGGYARLRPGLAIERDRVLPVSEKLGFHPALEPLMPLWKERELALALGVGYPEPNRSHFRSIEIWETGSSSRDYLEQGWIGRLFAGSRPPASAAADAVTVGAKGEGPFKGRSMRSVSLDDPERFARQAARLTPHAASAGGNRALAHLLGVEQDVRQAARSLESRLAKAPPLGVEFPQTRLGRQLETVARLLAAGVQVPAVRVAHTGFDTHANQAGAHERLLGELAGGLAVFRKALDGAGLWQRTLVMTYSEFGRRARENGSRGTDHGTAAPHFLLGGRVRGGLYGRQPSLTDLVAGDLRHHVDYRQLYVTVARRWWGFADDGLGGSFEPLDCLG